MYIICCPGSEFDLNLNPYSVEDLKVMRNEKKGGCKSGINRRIFVHRVVATNFYFILKDPGSLNSKKPI